MNEAEGIAELSHTDINQALRNLYRMTFDIIDRLDWEALDLLLSDICKTAADIQIFIGCIYVTNPIREHLQNRLTVYNAISDAAERKGLSEEQTEQILSFL